MDPPPSLLLAFGFGHLAMLGWLAAAAAPWIIHLWSRRKHREVLWAAIPFLLAALEKNARRIRLEQWLLLVVRTLILVCVVLAVAEPYAERLGMAYAPSVRTHRMFVLDGSYSMAYRPVDGSLFNHAKRLIRGIVDAGKQGDALTMVLMGQPPRVLIGRPTFSKQGFLAELDSVTLPDSGGDLEATLGLVADILQRVPTDQPALDRQEVYFVTDLGRTTWQVDPEVGTASPDSSQGPGRERTVWDRLAGMAELYVIDVGLEDAQNLAVTQWIAAESFAVVGREGTFDAVARNFGTQPRSRCLVQFLVDDVPVEDRRIDIPAGSEVTVRFVHRFTEPGSHVLAVRLSQDLLEVDDTRWLALSVQPHLRVLCVEGKHHAAWYVANALAPEPSSAALIRVETIQESELVERDLSEFDAVFLCNIGQLTFGEVEEIDRYLQRGGGLVFFLGDRVIPERLNHALARVPDSDGTVSPPGPGGERIPLLPVRIGELVDPDKYQFDPLDYRHPIVRPFRGHDAAGLLSSPIARYFRLEMLPEMHRAELVLAFVGGDPAVVIAPVHRGHVAVVATAGSMASVDPETNEPWTAWPVWPSFLPVVRGLLDHTLGGRRDARNVRVGQPFGDILADMRVTKGDKIEVTRPDGVTHVVRLQSESGQLYWRFPATDRAGVYRVVGGSVPDSGTQFAVNVDTVESDLTRMLERDLPKQLTVHKTWTGFDPPDPLQVVRPYPMHRGLIYLAIFFMFVESFLAWKYGKAVA